MTERPARAFEPPIDRSQRGGSTLFVLLLAAVLVGGAAAVTLLDGAISAMWVLAFLAVLAALGIFALFGFALGVLRFAGRAVPNDLGRALAAEAEDGMVAVDAAGDILFANAAYLALTGAGDGRQIRTIERVFAADPEAAEPLYRLAQSARAGKRVQEEFRVRLGPGGEPAWYRVRVRPLDQGGRRAAVWTIADVTRDRERQENVFQELQHAIDFLDHAPAGFFSTEPDGTITYMNATLAEWLGIDLAQLGTGAHRLGDILAGDGAALVAAAGGEGGTVRTDAFDIELRTRTGQTMPARLLHKVAYAADGTAGASRTLVLDRSRAGDVSESVRAAEVRFARFFNNTPLAIATVDRAGRVRRGNGSFARLFGDLVRAADGRSIRAALNERDREPFDQALAAALAGQGDPRPLDVALVGDGARQARFYLSAVDDEGDGEAAIVYALDTTEQRALEMQFTQSQKMQAVGQLAGGVAHDFNNVLTAIIGYSDLLLASHRPTDPSFQDIMQIKQNASRAAGLVRQLLAFSRRQTLRPQVLAIGEVIAELRMLLARLLGEKIKLEVVHGRDLWPVKADLNQFEQVIVNLAVNARDAMPGGGTLTIRTRNLAGGEASELSRQEVPAGDWVMVEVEDTGTGIAKDIIDKIFEPFFSTKEVGKGTGLGLSTVYGIVRQTGGYVHVESELGRGTEFRIFLPRHVAEAGQAELPAEPAPAAAPTDLTGRGTVLLVEDEDAVRSFATRALESRGYTVLSAASGVEALELLDSGAEGIDLVVSDVVMPEMDGPTLLKELRRRRPDLKVIFVSGYAEDAFKRNLDDGERFVFLPKPFSLKQLVQAVKETMGG
ncbi:MAG TPA: PAS domain-containing protein [Hyphomicrobiales bacterium]|nr:PAS domain-containing protein [Hyphomicrobiales bacterium]